MQPQTEDERSVDPWGLAPPIARVASYGDRDFVRSTRQPSGPRLALAQAVLAGLMPPEALGSQPDVALEDADRVARWRTLPD